MNDLLSNRNTRGKSGVSRAVVTGGDDRELSGNPGSEISDGWTSIEGSPAVYRVTNMTTVVTYSFDTKDKSIPLARLERNKFGKRMGTKKNAIVLELPGHKRGINLFKTGSCTISGRPDMDSVEESVEAVADLIETFCGEKPAYTMQVCNLWAACRFGRMLSLVRISEKFSKDPRITYDSGISPALQFRLRYAPKKYTTMMVFTSGSITVIGAPSEEHVVNIIKEFTKIVDEVEADYGEASVRESVMLRMYMKPDGHFGLEVYKRV